MSASANRLPRLALGALGLVAASYAAVVGAVCIFQRNLLYLPDPREIAPPAALNVQVVRLATADGERLVSWYLPPAPGKPVILYFSGNGDSLARQALRWRKISQAGVGVLAVGYRGYSGSTGRPTEAGLHEDARTAYRWLAARWRPEDIVIHGYSLGSGVAVRLAAEQPARALVLEAPFTSVADVAAQRYPWAPARLLVWDRFASRDWIGKVRMPVLIVHGARDASIPIGQGRELYALAQQPKVFVDVAGGTHESLVRNGLYPRIWNFLGLESS